ncbi:MAG: hypothetical protein ACR2JY_11560 [Chloroflexota bacterium]
MLAAGGAGAPFARLADGVRLWREDGWYLAAGAAQQGPFLYRPTRTDVWEQTSAAVEDGNESVLAVFTRFDAAGEQVTFRQDYRLDPTGQRRLLHTSLIKAPPSPEVYEGLETPALDADM